MEDSFNDDGTSGSYSFGNEFTSIPAGIEQSPLLLLENTTNHPVSSGNNSTSFSQYEYGEEDHNCLVWASHRALSPIRVAQEVIKKEFTNCSEKPAPKPRKRKAISSKAGISTDSEETSRRAGKQRRVLGNRRVTCTRCYKKKIKCSFGDPCERCSRDGAECTYEDTYPGYKQERLVMKTTTMYTSLQNFDAIVSRYISTVTTIITPIIDVQDLRSTFDVWEALRSADDNPRKVLAQVEAALPSTMSSHSRSGSGSAIVSIRGIPIVSMEAFKIIVSFALGCRFCQGPQISRTKFFLDTALSLGLDLMEEMAATNQQAPYLCARAVYFISYLYRTSSKVFSVTDEDRRKITRLMNLLLKCMTPLRDPMSIATYIGVCLSLRRLDLAPEMYQGLMNSLAALWQTHDAQLQRGYASVISLGGSVLTWGVLTMSGEWLLDAHMYNLRVHDVPVVPEQQQRTLVMHLDLIIPILRDYLRVVMEKMPLFLADPFIAYAYATAEIVLGFCLWRRDTLHDGTGPRANYAEILEYTRSGIDRWWSNREWGVHPLDSTIVGNLSMGLKTLACVCPAIFLAWVDETGVLSGTFHNSTRPNTDQGQLAYEMLSELYAKVSGEMASLKGVTLADDTLLNGL